MPFPNQVPRPFTRENILLLDANLTGCYGIFRAGNPGLWIYVGKGAIRQRLLDHFGGDNPCILQHNPTHWVAATGAGAVNLEKGLILELGPVCNRQVG